MIRYIALSIVISLFVHGSINGQPVLYEIDFGRELGMYSGGLLALTIGLKLKTTIRPYTMSNAAPNNINDINQFDRVATKYNSLLAKKTSNILGYGSFLLHAVFPLHQSTKKDVKNISLVWGEVVLINAGLTSLSKHIFKRPRPYVYRVDDSHYNKGTHSAQASFVSGHTSMMASNMFFFASTFATYFPSSKWKPVVWGTAIIAPAAIGYLRVRAGVHYPTDVIAGYGLGALVGILIPILHKSKKNKVKLNADIDQIGIQYKF